MFKLTKSREETLFKKGKKFLDKNINNRKKDLDTLYNKTSFLSVLDEYSEEIGVNISCFNSQVLEQLGEKLLEKDYISEKEKEEIKRYITFFSQEIDRKVFFYKTKLENGRFSPYKKKEKNKNELDFTIIKEILEDKNSDESLINSVFKGLIKFSGRISEISYSSLIWKCINHPQLDKKILVNFLKNQTLEKRTSSYIEIKHGDDIDLNNIKVLILKSGRLEASEVLDLIELPYIYLWKYIINEYPLSSYLLEEYFEKMFSYKKEEDKRIVVNFILNNLLGIISKNLKIKNMLEEYIKEETEEEKKIREEKEKQKSKLEEKIKKENSKPKEISKNKTFSDDIIPLEE